jgi:multicomponent Na+:H+ antiporter subunit B
VSASLRRAVFAVGFAGFAALLVWALAGLPAFGEVYSRYASILAHAIVPERHVTDTVSAVNFDYRAIDTLGEELILFTAVVGAATVLRAQREEEERPSHDAESGGIPETSDAVRVLGVALIAITLMLGIYFISHGQLTPGGGFQGGVIVASGFLLVYLAGEFVTVRIVHPVSLMEIAHAAGAAGYALIGLGGLIAGQAFFHNGLGLGTTSDLLSGGTIPLSNVAVGVEVSGAFVLLFSEFLEQALIRRRGGGS